jgi:hypothetical protein
LVCLEKINRSIDLRTWRLILTCLDAKKRSAIGNQLEKEKIHLWINQAMKTRISKYEILDFSFTFKNWFNMFFTTASSKLLMGINIFLLLLLLLLLIAMRKKKVIIIVWLYDYDEKFIRKDSRARNVYSG